jgi:hypothetical protein
MVNWSDVIANIAHKEGSVVSTDLTRWNSANTAYDEIYSKWKKANFNEHSIRWINYYPEIDYSTQIVDTVADSLRLTGVHRSWISRIDPGYMAPWHWDVDDNEDKYLKSGEIIRYTIIAQNFSIGQIFILNDQHYYNVETGLVIKWKTHRDWHCGINASMERNYMFHILGYQ